MKIQIVNQSDNSIEFFVEREQGIYNNCNLTTEITDAEKEGLTQGQIYQLAWDRVKDVVYKVFNRIEPLDEIENPVEFEFEPLPVPESIPPEPPQPTFDDYLVDLDYRLSKIELGI